MDNTVDLTQPVKDILDQHPELLEILVDLGFKPLANPLMLQSAGRITSLLKGCSIIQLPVADLIQELEWNGYHVIGGPHD